LKHHKKDESRAQSADSLKAYRKPRAFTCLSAPFRKQKNDVRHYKQ